MAVEPIFESYGNKLIGVPNNEESGGSGGHVIENSSGTDLPQEETLQFLGVNTVDDSTNGKTKVNIVRNMTKAQMDALSSAEKEGFIHTTDEPDSPYSNISDAEVNFTEASERTNITSGESISTLFGKIKKWFTDLPSMFVSKSGDTMTGNFYVNRSDGTTSTVGTSQINLGNSIAQGTDKNSYGRLAIFGKGTNYTFLQATNSTANRVIELPDKAGTIAVYSEYTLEGTTTASGALLIPDALRMYNFIALQYANDSTVTVGFIFRREYSYITCLNNSLTPVSETTVKVKIVYI